MLVEITDKGMKHWDDNMPKTDYGDIISNPANASVKEQGLFVLGLLYGLGPDDPKPLIKQNKRWAGIINGLERDGYVEIYPDA